MIRSLPQRIAEAAVFSLCIAVEMSFAATPDYLTYDRPGTQLEDPMEEGLWTGSEPDKAELLPRLEEMNPFWRDTGLDLQLRTYYLDKQRNTAADSETWALGGWLAYRSGLFRNRIQLGGTLYTAQKLYGPDDKPGTGLLKPVQQGFSVLGEAFVDVRLSGQAHLSLYRQTFKLPYVNKRDNRMVPNTFEAYLLYDRVDPRFNYVLGHVSKIKERDSDKFVYMSEDAGAEGTNKGLSTAGARYSFTPTTSLGAINHYGWDTFNTFYAEADGEWDITERLAFELSGQYTDQRSIGDAVVGDFDTNHFGVRSALSYRGATLDLAYTETGSGGDIRHPWGGFPGYISLIVQDFNRAGEKAWKAEISYDFTELGWDGLSGFINYAEGDTPDNGSIGSPDQEELDVTLDFRVPGGRVKGLWLRARAAFVNQHGEGASDQSDYRVIVNYSLPLL